MRAMTFGETVQSFLCCWQRNTKDIEKATNRPVTFRDSA